MPDEAEGGSSSPRPATLATPDPDEEVSSRPPSSPTPKVHQVERKKFPFLLIPIVKFFEWIGLMGRAPHVEVTSDRIRQAAKELMEPPLFDRMAAWIAGKSEEELRVAQREKVESLSPEKFDHFLGKLLDSDVVAKQLSEEANARIKELGDVLQWLESFELDMIIQEAGFIVEVEGDGAYLKGEEGKSLKLASQETELLWLLIDALKGKRLHRFQSESLENLSKVLDDVLSITNVGETLVIIDIVSAWHRQLNERFLSIRDIVEEEVTGQQVKRRATHEQEAPQALDMILEAFRLSNEELTEALHYCERYISSSTPETKEEMRGWIQEFQQNNQDRGGLWADVAKAQIVDLPPLLAELKASVAERLATYEKLSLDKAEVGAGRWYRDLGEKRREGTEALRAFRAKWDAVDYTGLLRLPHLKDPRQVAELLDELEAVCHSSLEFIHKSKPLLERLSTQPQLAVKNPFVSRYEDKLIQVSWVEFPLEQWHSNLQGNIPGQGLLGHLEWLSQAESRFENLTEQQKERVLTIRKNILPWSAHIPQESGWKLLVLQGDYHLVVSRLLQCRRDKEDLLAAMEYRPKEQEAMSSELAARWEEESRKVHQGLHNAQNAPSYLALFSSWQALDAKWRAEDFSGIGRFKAVPAHLDLLIEQLTSSVSSYREYLSRTAPVMTAYASFLKLNLKDQDKINATLLEYQNKHNLSDQCLVNFLDPDGIRRVDLILRSEEKADEKLFAFGRLVAGFRSLPFSIDDGRLHALRDRFRQEMEMNLYLAQINPLHRLAHTKEVTKRLRDIMKQARRAESDSLKELAQELINLEAYIVGGWELERYRQLAYYGEKVANANSAFLTPVRALEIAWFERLYQVVKEQVQSEEIKPENWLHVLKMVYDAGAMNSSLALSEALCSFKKWREQAEPFSLPTPASQKDYLIHHPVGLPFMKLWLKGVEGSADTAATHLRYRHNVDGLVRSTMVHQEKARLMYDTGQITPPVGQLLKEIFIHSEAKSPGKEDRLP